MSKINKQQTEPEEWKQGTNWQGRWEGKTGDKTEKIVKSLIKAQVQMTHGHGQ